MSNVWDNVTRQRVLKFCIMCDPPSATIIHELVQLLDSRDAQIATLKEQIRTATDRLQGPGGVLAALNLKS
jgi:hypothetical protein